MRHKTYITAGVRIRTRMSREELARAIASSVCGGIEFELEDVYERYEEPAVDISRPFLGLSLSLIGESGYYLLQLEQTHQVFDDLSSEVFDNGSSDDFTIELSEYLLYLVCQLEGVEVELASEPEGDDVAVIE